MRKHRNEIPSRQWESARWNATMMMTMTRRKANWWRGWRHPACLAESQRRWELAAVALKTKQKILLGLW